MLLPLAAIALMVLAIGASAGPIGTAQGFEDDDGNLVDNAGAGIDWNTFSPVTWAPHPATTPTRQATKSSNGFNFLGIEDWQATTSDSGFAGGTKQDDNCPGVITAKADNKADLKRIYVASTVVNGETYLDLAWVRIPQNTTSPSAHVAFEFNQGTTACGSASDGLVNRTAGDLLVVYDFEGGTTDTPTITIRKWVTSGACEVSSDSAPCWGVAQNLTAAGFAEAKVLVGSTATDALTPPALNSSTGTSVSGTIGDREFGEAGLDLGPNGANIFPTNQCVSFGKVYGVSRTSGNSGTAQMKDLVGPAPFNLTNCGEIKIIKHTDPRGLDQNFSYTSSIAGGQLSCTSDSTPASFTLNDNGNSSSDSSGNTEDCTNVPIGSYTVTEGADPSGFVFESLSCSATGTGTSAAQHATGSKQADITIASGGVATCTYVNQQQLGAIKISKTSSKSGNALAGATFSITKGGTAISGSPFTTDANGEICVDGLGFGGYVVTETGAPTGFAIDDSTGHTITVDNNAKCSDSTYVGESRGWTDSPLSDIQVNFKDDGSGETNNSGTTIVCDPANGNGTDSTTAATGWQKSLTRTSIATGSTNTVINCTITIDP